MLAETNGTVGLLAPVLLFEHHVQHAWSHGQLCSFLVEDCGCTTAGKRGWLLAAYVCQSGGHAVILVSAGEHV